MFKDRGSDQHYRLTHPANSSMIFQKHCANGLREIIEASSAGCDFCKAFLSCLTPPEANGVVVYSRSHDVEDKATYYSVERIDGNKNWPMEHFRLPFLWPSFANSEASSSIIAGRFWKTFKIMPAAPLPTEKIINPLSRRAQNAAEFQAVEPRNLTGMPTSTSTWSPAEVKLAKIWIDSYVHGHECGRNAPAQYVPSRLIHVGNCESPCIRLCERSDTFIEARYTSLSYCWGKTSNFTLKAANLQDMKTSIPYEALPKTIQHAITITRDLDVSYLWVDSLCIVQDSTEDWERECAAMGNTYSGSYCNIATTGAQDKEEGCIFQRNPAAILSLGIELNPPVQLNSNGDPIQSRYLANMPPGRYSIMYDEDVWAQDIINSPLLQRAWVVQERLMAPRNLHFGKRQLAFECGDWIACETFPVGYPGKYVVSTRYWKELCSLRAAFPKGRLEPYTVDTMRCAWTLLLDVFTKGQLSKPENKLAAIFGIAADIGKYVGSPYVAGLWTDLLPEQLLWLVEASAKELKARTLIYQAPTWSWAAVNNPVKGFFALGTRKPIFCFLISRVAVEAETYDMVINQGQPRLRLQGKILEALLMNKDPPHHSNGDLFNLKIPEFAEATIVVSPDHQVSAGRFISLPILASSYGPNYAIDIEGLLLERNHGKGTLSRIGYFGLKINRNVSNSLLVQKTAGLIDRVNGNTLLDDVWQPDDIEIE